LLRRVLQVQRQPEKAAVAGRQLSLVATADRHQRLVAMQNMGNMGWQLGKQVH